MVVRSKDELLTVEEVAQLLTVLTSGVCERYRERVSDPLPYVKLRKYLHFRGSDLIRKPSSLACPQTA